MPITQLRRFSLAIACNVFIAVAQAGAQLAHQSVDFLIDQHPQEIGGSRFKLSVRPFPITGEPANATAVAPDGTEFGIFHGQVSSIEFDSFSDLAIKLFGDWTVYFENTSRGPLVSYDVRVDPFTLNDVFSETPLIISPPHGSQVSTEFVLKWQYPAGAPNSRGMSSSHTSNLAILGIQDGVDGPMSRQVQTKIIGPGPALYSFSVNAATILDSPDILRRDPGLNGVSIQPFLAFSSHSLRTQVQVVPEPSTSIISAVLIAPMIAIARIRKLRFRR
jgi:hypothetical protein